MVKDPLARRERPRDELGRPLPWGSDNRLDIEDYDALTPDQDHALGLRAYAEGRFFPAHEAWESAWRQLRGDPDEEFFKGLAQLGAGFVHWQRGNPWGARVLLTRAATRLEGYRPAHRGVDVDALVSDLRGLIDSIPDVRRNARQTPQPLRVPKIASA